MFSQEGLLAWYQRLAMSQPSCRLLDSIRSSGPSRRVRSGRLNVCGRYPSQKMGMTIQFESHRVELAAIYEMEYDKDVLEYYDQPPPIKLDYKSAGGRCLGVLHTPDFFVFRQRKAGWEEWKTEEDLCALAQEKPNRYLLDDNGKWRCPPGEAVADPLGLYYRVRSSREIDWTYQRNIQFLEDYLKAGAPAVAVEVQQKVLAWAENRSISTLGDLFRATPDGVRRDDFYWLIARGVLRVDLTSGSFLEPDSITLLAISDRPGLCQEAAPPQSCNRPPEVINTAQPLLLDAGPESMAEALRRLRLIECYQQGKPLEEGVSARTVRYWIQRYRTAVAQHGDGLLGLMPKLHQSGNRCPKLPDKTRVLMSEYVETQYETFKQKPRIHVYGALIRACEAHGTPSPSFKTFCRTISLRPRHEQLRKRKGARAAYGAEPQYVELDLKTPRHGEWPFHICHIDHTELDVELLCSSTRRNLGRPWLSLLTDAFSRRILAVSLSFDPPSYRACMMIFRECVRRYNRLPQVLIMDGGKEFESIYFESLLARYECVKKSRPPAKPRFGAVCERLFGTATSQFLSILSGNTKMSKEARLMTASVDPKRHAVWTLERLHNRLIEWAYEFYDTTPHSVLGQSPRDYFVDGLARAGHRPHRSIPFNEDFRMATFPTTDRGRARIIPGKGIKIHYLYYWSSAFREPAVEDTKVPVRYDPYDLGVAYAYVENRWVSCCSEHYATFRSRSEREVMLATAELRKRLQSHGQNLPITAKRLADFAASVEAEEALMLQRLRDAEAKRIQSTASDIRAYSPPGSSVDDRSVVHECPDQGNVKLAPMEVACEPELFGEY